ncbi:MAG TPA: PHB depolymerase family esterase [Hanamia sp.]
MKKIFIFIFYYLIFISAQTQNTSRTITVDGLQRDYIIHLPPSFNALKQLPLIFALHGGGGTAESAVRFYDLESLADKNNFIIVYPDAVKKAWSIPGMASRVKGLDTTVNDLHFMNTLLDTMIANYKADPTKVFCTGISRGAMFSYYLADAMNSRITAIAAVCGGISNTQAQTYFLKTPLPVLIINGTGDPLVKYDGGYGTLNKRNKGNEDADMLPTGDLVKKIVSLDHCNAVPQTLSLPNTDPYDGCTETEYIYDGDNVKVDFIKIENGGHTWAGGTQYLPKFLIGRLCKDFSASQKIFDFFMSVK